MEEKEATGTTGGGGGGGGDVGPKSISSFVQSYTPTNLQSDPLPIKVHRKNIYPDELESVGVQHAFEYMQSRGCDPRLIQQVLVSVRKELSNKDCDPTSAPSPMELMHQAVSIVDQQFSKLKEQDQIDGLNEVLPYLAGVEDVAYHCIKNTRRSMEDMITVLPNCSEVFDETKDFAFFGVYDGHNGSQAASFCASRIHREYLEAIRRRNQEQGVDSEDPTLLRHAFIQTDNYLLKYEGAKSGATAVSAVISERQILVAWAGDSQALFAFGTGQVKPLVKPHQPYREDEQERIRRMGGEMFEIGGKMRVNGVLSITRAIGDGDYKDYIISTPDIVCIDREKVGEKEEYLILASDGLWEVVSPVDAANAVNECILQNNGKDASRALCALAKSEGSSDNTAVIIIYLKPLSVLAQNIRNRNSPPVEYEGEFEGMRYLESNRRTCDCQQCLRKAEEAQLEVTNGYHDKEIIMSSLESSEEASDSIEFSPNLNPPPAPVEVQMESQNLVDLENEQLPEPRREENLNPPPVEIQMENQPLIDIEQEQHPEPPNLNHPLPLVEMQLETQNLVHVEEEQHPEPRWEENLNPPPMEMYTENQNLIQVEEEQHPEPPEKENHAPPPLVEMKIESQTQTLIDLGPEEHPEPRKEENLNPPPPPVEMHMENQNLVHVEQEQHPGPPEKENLNPPPPLEIQMENQNLVHVEQHPELPREEKQVIADADKKSTSTSVKTSASTTVSTKTKITSKSTTVASAARKVGVPSDNKAEKDKEKKVPAPRKPLPPIARPPPKPNAPADNKTEKEKKVPALRKPLPTTAKPPPKPSVPSPTGGVKRVVGTPAVVNSTGTSNGPPAMAKKPIAASRIDSGLRKGVDGNKPTVNGRPTTTLTTKASTTTASSRPISGRPIAGSRPSTGTTRPPISSRGPTGTTRPPISSRGPTGTTTSSAARPKASLTNGATGTAPRPKPTPKLPPSSVPSQNQNGAISKPRTNLTSSSTTRAPLPRPPTTGAKGPTSATGLKKEAVNGDVKKPATATATRPISKTPAAKTRMPTSPPKPTAPRTPKAPATGVGVPPKKPTSPTKSAETKPAKTITATAAPPAPLQNNEADMEFLLGLQNGNSNNNKEGVAPPMTTSNEDLLNMNSLNFDASPTPAKDTSAFPASPLPSADANNGIITAETEGLNGST